ncbi:MAG: PAS domain-containing protein, partial [Firmicutes bacterium]|nr:PAS domain-containing protein [Bacillota bacterium]
MDLEQLLRSGSFRALFNAIPAGLLIVGADGRVSFANEEARRILGGGVLLDSAGAHDGYKSCPGDVGERMKLENCPAVQAALRGEESRGLVAGIKKLDGKAAVVALSGAPIKDESGNISGAVGVIQEISEQANPINLRNESEREYALELEAA